MVAMSGERDNCYLVQSTPAGLSMESGQELNTERHSLWIGPLPDYAGVDGFLVIVRVCHIITDQ